MNLWKMFKIVVSTNPDAKKNLEEHPVIFTVMFFIMLIFYAPGLICDYLKTKLN